MRYVLPGPESGLAGTFTDNTGAPEEVVWVLDENLTEFGLFLFEQHITSVGNEIFTVFLTIDNERFECEEVLIRLVLGLGYEKDVLSFTCGQPLLEILEEATGGEADLLRLDY